MNTMTPATNHGGMLIPLDMFRISHLVGITAELLVSKARNILDAKLVLTRHPASQLVLARIEGSVIGDDAVGFWRENADIAVACSQVLPRQCFLYYAKTAPPAERREGFVVAQRGQMLAADDSNAEQGGADHWPVTQLCQQLRISLDDLAAGFPGGPRVEVQLVEPVVDDQAALMTLAGQTAGAEGATPGAARPAAPAGAAPAGAPGRPAAPKRESVEDDIKRREKERAADEAEQQRRSAQLTSDLVHQIDDLGVVVVPHAELSEADILAPYIRGTIAGDLPPGVPRNQIDALQGKRADIAIKVDFLSEVFVENAPLTRTSLEERAETRTIAGREVRVLEVLAPRLGYGTLVTTGKAPHVFVSRKPEMPLPEDVITRLLA
jgi:hypothetical protein